MKKNLYVLFLSAVFIAPVVSFAYSREAATFEIQAQIKTLEAQLKSLRATAQSSGVSSSGSGSVGVGVTVPSKSPPIVDDNTSNDDIVQLNNLQIQSISGETVSATQDFGVRCEKFSAPNAARGQTYPCPASPTFLYQIKVDTDTRLLLRNRQRATLADFAVGDRINVYGFMDRTTQSMDALIMRNLDKPVVRQFIQLNSIDVSSPLSSSQPPATFVVTQKIISPCLDFGQSGVGRGMAFPCPMGIEMRSSVSPTNGSATSMLYPMPRSYTIEVTEKTYVFQKDRIPMALNMIEVGDSLNIYGLQKGNSGSIEALIIRDLSKPTSKGTASLRLSVSDQSIVCITTPCGVIYNAKAELYGANGSVVASGSTQNGSIVLENLRPGTYTLLVTAPGYEPYKESKTLSSGIETLAVSLHKTSEGALSYSVQTDKSTYDASEKIVITMVAKNNLDQEQTLQFNSGCQVSYSVENFDSSSVTPCTMALTSVTIAPHAEKTWTMVHIPELYRLHEGTYKLVGRVIGYGEAKTEVTIADASSFGRAIKLSVQSTTNSPQTVQFTATLKGFPSCGSIFNWDFGDGQRYAVAESCVQPITPNTTRTIIQIHTYTKAGIYTPKVSIDSLESNLLEVKITN